MNLRGKRWLFRLALLLILGLIALLWSIRESGRNLTIENRSDQVIDELKITIAGQVTTFAHVKTGDEVSAPCPPSDKALPFTVQCKLADGKIFHFNGQIRESQHFRLLPNGQFQPRRKGWFG